MDVIKSVTVDVTGGSAWKYNVIRTVVIQQYLE